MNLKQQKPQVGLYSAGLNKPGCIFGFTGTWAYNPGEGGLILAAV